jgi:hypothetical protein
MQAVVYFCLLIYLSFYLFEGPIRYGLNAIGGDSLIFIRDIVLIAPLALSFFVKRPDANKLHPAFYIFGLIVFFHGLVSFFNIGSVFVIVYCIKMLITMLVGAVLAEYLIAPPEPIVKVLFILWVITFFGVVIDKYEILTYPWTGLMTNIGDMQVDISRDWDITGEDKRAGGLMRSSISVAIVTPLLALLLIFNIKSLFKRLIIMIMTLLVVYWSTQKASILAFIFVCGLLLAAYKRPAISLKIGISVAVLLMVLLPVILPHFIMPNGEGVFSMASFYMRVEDMWPKAWLIIEQRGIFPFGIGLGGVGGAQRFYSPDDFNAADNLFVLLYAYFGILSFVYIGWVWFTCMRVSNQAKPPVVNALSMVLFIIFYGIALSMIEDQMASLFLGAAVSYIASNSKTRLKANA